MLVAVGFSSSMMLSLVDWSYIGKCIEEGLFPGMSDGDRTCTDIIPHAFACSCAAEWKIHDDYKEKGNVIFSGTVSDIITQERSYLVTLDIIDSWKGIPFGTGTINIMTSQSSASCGVNFEANQSYLVVGHGPWDQTPTVSSCSSTTLLDFADPQVAYLNDVTQEPEFIVKDVKFLQDIIYPDELGFYEVEITDKDGNPVEMFVTGRVDYIAPWGESNFSPVGNYDKQKERFVGELTPPREIAPGTYTLQLSVHGLHGGPLEFSGIKQVEFEIREKPGSMNTLFLPASMDKLRGEYRFFHKDEPREFQIQLIKGHYYSSVLANHTMSILVYGIDEENNENLLQAVQKTSDENGFVTHELDLSDRTYCEYDVVFSAQYDGFEDTQRIGYRMTNTETYHYTWNGEDIPVTVEGNCSVPLSMEFDQQKKTMTVQVDTTDAKKSFQIEFPHRLLDGDLSVVFNGDLGENSSVEKRKDVAIVNIKGNSDITTVQIIGTSAIPEFGQMALLLLGAAILPIVILARKSRFRDKSLE